MIGDSRPQRLCTVSLVLVLLLPGVCVAHLPEFFGRKYVLTSDEAPPPKPCGGDRDALRAEIKVQKGLLDAQRAEDGAYDITLADPQGELAGLYAQLCNHPAALKQLREALQRLRISDGLLAASQLPIVRAMADSYLAIGDFESAQLALRSALRVHGMAVGSVSEEGLRDSLAYFRLARNVFIDPRWGRDIGLFFQAFQDNDEAWDRQLERKTAYATLRGLGLSHLRNYYVLLGTDLDSGVAGSEPGGAAWDFLYRSQLLSYRQGLEILEVLSAAAEEHAPQHVAEYQFRLGNWHMWNGKYRSACDAYALAWSLAAPPAGAALREQMAEPAELPEDQALWDALQSSEIPERATIEASFSVSQRGNVSAMDAKVLGGKSDALAGRLGRWIKDSHIRPAIVDGACAAGELKGRRYRLLD
ncbi:MAG: tetratricopeptide repeat protein [Pseudomonadota bacterium]